MFSDKRYGWEVLRKQLKHDKTLVEWVATVLDEGHIGVTNVDSRKGTITIKSMSTNAVHVLKFERVR